jgi:hypothetical protein
LNRFLPLVTLLVGLAVGGAAVWMLRQPEATPPAEPAPSLPEAPLDERAEIQAPADVRVPTDLELDPERKYYSPPPEDPPADVPTKVEYPLVEKYLQQSFSEIPYTLVGAWDERRDEPQRGIRRAFVAVVDPAISDADLETLARQIRSQHEDAEILNVRIFDSEDAATRPTWLDGGAYAWEHLVAEVKRNTRVPAEVIRVRGRLLTP